MELSMYMHRLPCPLPFWQSEQKKKLRKKTVERTLLPPKKKNSELSKSWSVGAEWRPPCRWIFSHATWEASRCIAWRCTPWTSAPWGTCWTLQAPLPPALLSAAASQPSSSFSASFLADSAVSRNNRGLYKNWRTQQLLAVFACCCASCNWGATGLLLPMAFI